MIYETNPSEFYNQLSRRRHSSVSFADDFKPGFKPTARPDSEVEIARPEEPHRNTKRAFDIERLAPTSRATKAREGGGGLVSAPIDEHGAAFSAKRGGHGKASGARAEAGISGR